MTESTAPSVPPPAKLHYLPPVTSLSALAASKPPVVSDPVPNPPPSAPPSRKLGFVARHAISGMAFAGICVAALTVHHTAQHGLQPNVHHGTAGTKYTQAGSEIRWHLSKTEVLLDASIDDLGPTARDAVQSAFQTWLGSDPKLPRVSFRKVENTVFEAKPDGKNSVIVAPIKIAGHEHDLAITLTYSDQTTGEIVEADIVINSEYPFRVLDDEREGDSSDDQDTTGTASGVADSSSSAEKKTVISSARASCTAGTPQKTCDGGSYDVQNVATHEVGHFFGLGEDMDDTGATMYFCTNRCETHKRVLTDDDKTVMASLYVASEDPLEADSSSAKDGAGCGGARFTPRGDAKHAIWTLCAPLLGLVVRRLRKPRAAR